MSMKQRGFEVVKEDMRESYVSVDFPTGRKKMFYDITLPKRADSRSAGYDFYAPKDIEIMPGERKVMFTDVKAYMQDDEVLELYIRSSLGVKHGLILSNGTGVIDSSYYNNEDNDGNIGIPLWNTSGKAVRIKAGNRVAQGVFKKYLTADVDETIHASRKGGTGSSGE